MENGVENQFINKKGEKYKPYKLFELLSGDLRILPVLIAIAIIWIIFSVQNPAFISSRNITNLLLQSIVTGIIALGVIHELLVAEIDLSVAAMSAVAATITATLLVNFGWNVFFSVGLGIASGVFVGLVQGAWVAFSGAPSFLVTFGSSLALGGAHLALMPPYGQVNLAGTAIELIAGAYLPYSAGWLFVLLATIVYGLLSIWSFRAKLKVGMSASLIKHVVGPTASVTVCCAVAVIILNNYRGVPVALAIFLILISIFSYITTQTRFGLYMYAIGGNIDTAIRAGIPVKKIKIAAFMIAGGMSAIGGIVASSRLLGVSAQSGGGTLLLEAIAAAVIGGTSLFGGRGSVWAALLGALIIGSISNGMDLVGLGTEAKMTVTGAILVFAITIDAIMARGTLFEN